MIHLVPIPSSPTVRDMCCPCHLCGESADAFVRECPLLPPPYTIYAICYICLKVIDPDAYRRTLVKSEWITQ